MKNLSILLLLLPFFSCAQNNKGNNKKDKEKQLVKKVDGFMATWRDKWIDLEKKIDEQPDSATAGRIKAYQTHPFFKAYNGFIEENGKEYIAVRTRFYEQYAPPPEALLQLSWQKPEWTLAEEEQTNLTLLSLAFLRTFDPLAVSNTAYNIILPNLMSTHHFGIDEAQKIYGIRERYGVNLYAKKISDTVWQAWAADRLWAVSFHFNIRTGMLFEIRHTTPGDPKYAAIQWPESLVKPVTESNHLWADLTKVLWNSYSGNKAYDSLPYNYHKAMYKKQIEDFSKQQHGRYVKVRRQSLEQLDNSTPDLSAYNELTTPEDNVLRDEDTSFFVNYYFDHSQWESSIANAASLYFKAGEKEIIRRIQYNIFFPATHYARKLNNDEWEVWSLNDTDAVYYIWNINTGQVRQTRYWVKK